MYLFIAQENWYFSVWAMHSFLAPACIENLQETNLMKQTKWIISKILVKCTMFQNTLFPFMDIKFSIEQIVTMSDEINDKTYMHLQHSSSV